MAIGKQVPDKTLLVALQRKLQQKCTTANKISIDVRSGDVTLTGKLKMENERKPILRCLQTIPGVRRVTDKMELEERKKPSM